MTDSRMSAAGAAEDETPLDAGLAEAVRALPRMREPGRLLEERTVRALAGAGLLRGRRRVWRGQAAAAAAALALFAGGVATGQWLSGRQTAALLAAQQQATVEELAALIEQTGAAYVSAVARLAESAGGPGAGGSTGTRNSDEARNSAVQFLHRAANEVVRLAPNDPVAAKILQGFDHAALQRQPTDARERQRHIVWF